jgi:quercetin dioxygenase-like cupin family protein
LFQKSPSNIPDHYYIGFKVTMPPHAATPPHTHGGGTVVAVLLKGRVVNQMVCPEHDCTSQGTGAMVHTAGETWYEPPGCHHVRSENPDDTEAEFLAFFVVSKEKVDKEGLQSLVVIDAEVNEQAEGKPETG